MRRRPSRAGNAAPVRAPAPGPELVDTDAPMGTVRSWALIGAGHGVMLRRVEPADSLGVFAVHRDPRVYVFDPHEAHPDLSHTERFLDPMIDHWSAHGFGYWTVLLADEMWPDGTRGLFPGDVGYKIAGLGGIQHHKVADQPVLNVYFRFAPEVQGRGLATTVLQHAIDVASHVAPDVDLVIRTRPANVAARRVAERAGFIDEGLEPGDPAMQLLRLPGLEH